MINVPLLTLGACAGLCVGSFVSTAAIRTARHEGVWAGRSRCDACGVTLGFVATAPILGYVTRRGACTVCGSAIDPVHVIGEVAGAVLLTAPFMLADWARASLLALLGFVLLGAAVFDGRTRRLPNALTAIAAVVCATLAVMQGVLNLVAGLLAGAISILILQTLRWAYAKRRGEPGLGFGDVKLLGALAIWLGAATPWAVVVASALGLASVVLAPPKSGRIAFGPFIALGAMSVGLLKEASLWPQLL